MKNTEYYNNEDLLYSAKRYPKVDTDYVHFFFKQRLKILISILKEITIGKQNLNLLEVGCADGIVARTISEDIPAVNKIVGIDISPKMIEQAKFQNKLSLCEFHVRGDEVQGATYDIVVEVGVVNLTDRHIEYKYALDHLNPGGYYICTLASSTSLRSRLKTQDHKGGFAHLLTYKEYEEELRKIFDIVDSKMYGLFIPMIWKIPLVARFIQAHEGIGTHIFPSLFHEKIYVLKKRISNE